MRKSAFICAFGGLLLLPAVWSGGQQVLAAEQTGKPSGGMASAEGLEFFEKRIRPLLAEQCYPCHSAAAKNTAGGLAMDTRAGLLKGGTSGPALVPGDPARSLLIRSVRHAAGPLKMPPGKKLTDAQIADLEAWIRQGAPDPRGDGEAPVRTGFDWDKERQFWAYRPLKAAGVPAVRNKNWARTDTDRFVLTKLEERGLRPVQDADRRTLIRRAAFDLTGLPPTPDEIDAFVNDKSPNAWEKVVDRLLASPHYGERWGRHWLDLVRYADTSGCNSDFPIPTAYRYRNYVIRSFNQDKPYDQFLKEQIAGDLLQAKSDEQRFEQMIATGYLAIARRFGSQANEFHLSLEDTIDNLGKTMLGLSVSCARCHDHKYDPILAKDYYALYGIFQSSTFAFPGTEVVPDEKDLVILASGEHAERVRKYDAELSDLGPKIYRLRPHVQRLKTAAEKLAKDAEDAAQAHGADSREAKDAAAKAAEAKRAYEAENGNLQSMIARHKELLANPLNAPKAYAVSEGTPSNAKIHIKGDPRALGAEVPRGFLQVLGGQTLPEGYQGSGRLKLAEWIASPENPLTARVMVNRIWQGHFGQGIVSTPSDFGTRGQKPTHPELLDYLALKFIRSGWSIKAMHREMMLSRVYQLASVDEPRNLAVDVDNRLLWRYNRHRLDAESIRDAMLAVSGGLDRTMGEEHPFLPRKDWKYTQHRPFYAVYPTNRRSVYLMQQRIRKHPFLDTFDGADPNSNTAIRNVSTTAPQALYLMNDEFVHEQAGLLARRVRAAAETTDQQVQEAYRLAYGRTVTSQELAFCREFLQGARAELAQSGMAAEDLDQRSLASLMRVILCSSEFIFVD